MMKRKTETDEQEMEELENHPSSWLAEIRILKTADQLNTFTEKMKASHDEEDYDEKLGLMIQGMENLSVEESRRISCVIFNAELKFHGNLSSTTNCLKKKLPARLAKELLDNVRPGIIARMLPDKVQNWIKSNPWSDFLLIRTCIKVLSLTAFYLDFTKDFFFLCLMVSLVTLPTIFDPNFFYSFQNQMIWIWAASIFLPLIVSSGRVAIYAPLAIYGQKMDSMQKELERNKIIFLQVSYLLVFPLVPVMLLFTSQTEEETQKELLKEIHNLVLHNRNTKNAIKKFNMIQAFLRKVKQNILIIKMNEVMETCIQLVLQTLMLALYHSSTPTTRGLETVFSNDTDKQWISTTAYLLLSVLWSFSTSVRTRIKSKEASLNGFLPSKGAAFVAVRALLMTGVTTACVLAFFTPHLGLFSLLQHSHADKIPFVETLEQLTTPFSNNYVWVLQTGYIQFIILLGLNMLTILCCKITTSAKFRQASKWEMMRHAMDNLILPDVYADWSEGDGNIKDYKERRKNNCLEFCLMSVLQWLVHMLMFLPLWNLGKQYI